MLYYLIETLVKGGHLLIVKEKFTLDRVEDGVAICVSLLDGRVIHIPEELLSEISEGGVFEAELENDTLIGPATYLDEETQNRKKQAQSRLDSLFRRTNRQI